MGPFRRETGVGGTEEEVSASVRGVVYSYGRAWSIAMVGKGMGMNHMGQGRDHMGQGRITWDGKGSHGTGKGSHGTGEDHMGWEGITWDREGITWDREGITWDRGGSHGMGRVKVTLLDMRCCVDGGGGLPHLYGNYTMLCIARGGGGGGGGGE